MQVLSFKTVSDPAARDHALHPDQFDALDAYLAATYAEAFQAMSLERLGAGNRSYLLTWHGSKPGLLPALFISHVDVVPVTPESLADWCGAAAAGWVDICVTHASVHASLHPCIVAHAAPACRACRTRPLTPTAACVPLSSCCQRMHVATQPPAQHRTHPPFSGAVADGFIWGRGALDVKVGVVGLLEAATSLLRSGYAPRRTLLFAFGQDEEVGGDLGAAAIAAELAARGTRIEMIWDEGSGARVALLVCMLPFSASSRADAHTAHTCQLPFACACCKRAHCGCRRRLLLSPHACTQP